LLIRKTVKAKLHNLTKIKDEKLSREYQNFQLALKGEDINLYSATKQQAERVRRKIRKNGGKQIHENHPLIIRRDCFRVERQDTKLSKFWAKIPIYEGSIWVPIQLPYSQESLLKEDVRETKLIKGKKGWFLHITVQKNVDVKIPTNLNKIAVIGVDVGEANPVTSVVLTVNGMTKPKFHAEEVRGVRAHYSNLRKQIGKRKVKHALRVIKKIGNKERRIVEHHLHTASKAIVEQAMQLRDEGFNPVIVVGDLKIRKPRVKGETRCRKNNRKVHSMPFYKTKKFIEYKALWERIPVVFENEAYSTITCHRCGSRNTIVYKRLFRCLQCGLEYNRDLNASINMGNRFLDQRFKSRAELTQPQTPTANSIAGRSSEQIAIAKCDGRIP